MIALVVDQDVPRLRGVRCEAGLFGVVKKGSDLLRVVVELRRARARDLPFRQALWACLASEPLSNEERARVLRLFSAPFSSQFVDLVLVPNEELEVFLEVAKDFYYVLRWPEELWASSAV